jgi:hypothetical protein
MLDTIRRRMPDLTTSLTQCACDDCVLLLRRDAVCAGLIALDPELRFVSNITLALVRAGLVVAPDFDRHLAEVLAAVNDEPIATGGDDPLSASARRVADFAVALFTQGLAERGSLPIAGDVLRWLCRCERCARRVSARAVGVGAAVDEQARACVGGTGR